MNITLEYKRLQKEVNGEYPYTGEFKFIPDGEALSFIGWPFKRVIGFLSELLRKHIDVQEVTLQRIDRPGIMPMGFGPQMLQLLRTDPLAAYRVLDFNTSAFTTKDLDPTSDVAEGFDVFVYTRMSGGHVMDPLTGEWKPLAYGEKHGWKVRGDGTNHTKWVPLDTIQDDAPAGVTGAERLVFCQWARIDLEKLLELGADKYYLPRVWNPNPDGWIERVELEEMFINFLDNNGVEPCQVQ